MDTVIMNTTVCTFGYVIETRNSHSYTLSVIWENTWYCTAYLNLNTFVNAVKKEKNHHFPVQAERCTWIYKNPFCTPCTQLYMNNTKRTPALNYTCSYLCCHRTYLHANGSKTFFLIKKENWVRPNRKSLTFTKHFHSEQVSFPNYE